MSDLAAFLRARLDEDRDFADALAEDLAQMGPVIEGVTENKLHGLMRHTALRTLREAQAGRAILNEHEPGYPVTFPEPSGQPTCGICHAGGWDWDPCAWPCATVRHLAAVYSDHPDYDEAWRP